MGHLSNMVFEDVHLAACLKSDFDAAQIIEKGPSALFGVVLRSKPFNFYMMSCARVYILLRKIHEESLLRRNEKEVILWKK